MCLAALALTCCSWNPATTAWKAGVSLLGDWRRSYGCPSCSSQQLANHLSGKKDILDHSGAGSHFRSIVVIKFASYSGQATEKAMAPHSSTLAWKIPWTEEPGGLQSMGSLRVGHDWATSLSLFTFTHWRRKWQPTPVFLPGESQGRGSLVGCRLSGCTVGHNWSNLAAAAG